MRGEPSPRPTAGEPSRNLESLANLSKIINHFRPLRGRFAGYIFRFRRQRILYKVSSYYSPSHERGLRWNDPALGIDWGIAGDAALLAARDRDFPILRELPSFFTYPNDGAEKK